MANDDSLLKQAKALLKHNSMAKPPSSKDRYTRRHPGTVDKRFTSARQEKYLNALKEHGEEALARDEVGIHRETVKRHRLKTPGFNEAEEEAMRIYRARLAATVHRRGVDGVQEPIYWNGLVVGWVTKYSDRMLELQVKRHIPEYRDKVTVNQEHSGTVALLSDLSKLPPDIRTDLKAIIKRIEQHQEDQDAE